MQSASPCEEKRRESTAALSQTAVRVAVVSFMPDAGHVVPLLRIAAALVDAGHEVQCLLPRQCGALAADYGLPFVTLGDVGCAGSERALEEFEMGETASGTPPTVAEYLGWLQVSASQTVAAAKAALTAFQPSILVADSHLVDRWYARLAELARVPLVLHRSEGTRHAWMPYYTRRHGFSRLPMFVQTRVGWLQEWLGRREAERRPLSPELQEALREMEDRLRSELGLGGDGLHEGRRITISTGLGVLEEQALGINGPANVKFMGPLTSAAVPKLAPDLQAWLDERAQRGVIYVSFGTMVRVSKRQAEMVLEALARLRRPALWSLPSRDQERLGLRKLPPEVRLEPHVQQRAVLASAAVRCVLTHGGAGTVQEALLAEKPLLCMPFFWDQFYVSSFVEVLGVGRRCCWPRATSARLARHLRALIAEAPFRDCVTQVAAELRNQNGNASVVELIKSLAGDSRA